jgi:hypothetical protein
VKYAVHTHGGKNWDDIATLVPGRTRKQCHSRWYNASKPSIDQMGESSGRWTVDEDSKLRMFFKGTVTRDGSQLPRWFQVERKRWNITWTLIVAQSAGKKMALSIRSLICGSILTARRMNGRTSTMCSTIAGTLWP